MSSLLVVGLGNPGDRYVGTRHNVGFMVVHALVQHIMSHYNCAPWRVEKKFSGYMTSCLLGETKVFFLLPMTYMNKSGSSVTAVCRFYNILPERVVVVHDELDIPFGRFRWKQGGGAGGHNGVKDIHALLQSPDFWRLRVGIDRPQHKEHVVNYVLSQFSSAEQERLPDILRDASNMLLDHIDQLSGVSE